jgi:glycosyltransferase involved in cell wall biosynthesis
MRSRIILEATEACNPERRGIGMQMRAWLEAAPYTDFPQLQFIIATREVKGAEPLTISAPNVQIVTKNIDTEAAYIDYLYKLDADLIFFSLATRQYVRNSPIKRIGIDYGMEDFYCRNYIAPKPLYEFMEEHEFALQNFTCVITVSQTSRRDLAWFFPDYKDKIKVIYPGTVGGVESTGLAILPDALQGARYFLIMGYEHKKNICRIADAFNAFKQHTGSQIKLAIAGKPGYGAAEIDNHISSLPYAADIIRLGYISGNQKQLLIQKCQAVVALPIYEGFGISALEGLEAGKIVLVSDNGSLKEIVGRAGFTANPFSIADMEKQFMHIDGLKLNPKQQYVDERVSMFNQTKQTRNLLSYFDEILNARQKPAPELNKRCLHC